MSCGKDFVETLKKIGYPKAEALNGEDFDWLFETAEGASFLRWFCGTVSEQNVLSREELEAFGALQKSGRPLLEGAALEEALRTCRTSDVEVPTPDDDADLEKLEEEVRALQKVKNLRIQRRNKGQVMASVTRHKSLRLNAKEAAAAKKLKQSQGMLNAVSTKIRNELQALADGVAKLMVFFRPPSLGQGTNPPVFLSQIPLEKYLGQEEQCTAALTLYTKKQFFQGIQEVFESSNEENFQLFDMQAPSTYDDQETPEERRLEMARLQLAYICAQHQLIHLKARNSSMKSSIKWAEENLHSFTSKVLGKDLDAKISSLNIQILKLKEQITHIKDKSLPAVVKMNAQLLNMPVVKGDFDLQIAKQDYYTERQEFILNQLLKQKASFELLQLSYEIEMRKHWDVHRQLEKLVHELSQSNMMLHKQLEMLADPSVSQQINPRSTIDTKDYSTHRLHQLLEGENKKKELFITHENLEEVAKKLKQDVSLVQNQLAISAQEHSLFLSRLNNDVDMLCDVLYQGGNQLLLSDQELTEQFHQVEAQLNKLNHLLTDILADVKTKRKILASNKLHQMERELYVYFCKDEDYLKEIVENLENQSKIKAADLKD